MKAAGSFEVTSRCMHFYSIYLQPSALVRAAEKTLRIEIDDDAFDRVYGHKSHPIPVTKLNQKIAVRVISQFGEDSTKVLVS